jgi:hypothetical protein
MSSGMIMKIKSTQYATGRTSAFARDAPFQSVAGQQFSCICHISASNFMARCISWNNPEQSKLEVFAS